MKSLVTYVWLCVHVYYKKCVSALWIILSHWHWRIGRQQLYTWLYGHLVAYRFSTLLLWESIQRATVARNYWVTDTHALACRGSKMKQPQPPAESLLTSLLLHTATLRYSLYFLNIWMVVQISKKTVKWVFPLCAAGNTIIRSVHLVIIINNQVGRHTLLIKCSCLQISSCRRRLSFHLDFNELRAIKAFSFFNNLLFTVCYHTQFADWLRLLISYREIIGITSTASSVYRHTLWNQHWCDLSEHDVHTTKHFLKLLHCVHLHLATFILLCCLMPSSVHWIYYDHYYWIQPLAATDTSMTRAIFEPMTWS